MPNDFSHNNIKHIDLLIEVIRKNEHLIVEPSDNATRKKTYAFNSRVIMADNIDFLEAIRKDMGGELIISKNIGSFLYFDSN